MVRAGRVSSKIVLTCAVVAAISGCQLGAPGTGSAPAVASAPAGTASASVSAPSPDQRVIERDVEAPNVFQVEESGLWDGRPSLGGVWVAHPTARDPERVLIRNSATGQSVIGALFRRERENPGPRFQVSSEAANALGILAGAPTEIQVTALRLERIEMEIDPAPAAPEQPAAPTETAATENLPVAAAATPTPSAAPEGQVEIAEGGQPRRRSFFDRFRRQNREPEAEIAETTLAPAAGTAVAATAQAGAAGTQAAAQAAETATPVVAAAPAEPRRRSFFDRFRRRNREPEVDTTPIPLPEAATAPQPAPTSTLDRPYVQIGIFSVEQNATNARAQMQRAGLNAEIRRGRVGQNQFWRVVVGPATSTSERSTMLRRVRGLGFGDAYAVRR